MLKVEVKIVKLSLYLSNEILHEDVRGLGVLIQVFLTSLVTGYEWSPSRPCRFTPEK
jgi:hypothetical protein